jgi:hypothetical protein
MDHNKNIRNMSVIAHVDHVSSARRARRRGWIDADRRGAGTLLWDYPFSFASRRDEQRKWVGDERGVTWVAGDECRERASVRATRGERHGEARR